MSKQDKTDDLKCIYYQELRRVFDNFLKYHTNILLRDFNTKVGWEDILKQVTGNDKMGELPDE
jgi:hypothetical protein